MPTWVIYDYKNGQRVVTNDHPSTYPGVDMSCTVANIGAHYSQEQMGGGYAIKDDYECRRP
ncbi:hypothetical protein [Roseateles asaccharophilus]|uniref:hypothetical protein n=1 Tax=Roseateles asaccharophilus TaxID=582607 RepID=UPI00384FA1BF